MHKEKKNILLTLFVLFFSYLLIFELAIRLAIKPAVDSYGTLFGVELPPFDLAPPSRLPDIGDRSEWFEDLIIDGQKITIGDLWGYYRGDPLLGYMPLENTTSTNGWWQSNSIGAMARYEITESIQKNHNRILVFGESFASGSRVPQEITWPNTLDSMNENIEVINFAVDGYGTAQSYLRYRQVKDWLDYDLVLLVFVPSDDLWRDINIRRDLRGWELYWTMPRFIVDGEKLKLADNSFASDSSILGSGQEEADEAFRSFLREYDRFYFDTKFEEPWLVGKSILYKLVAKVVYEYKTNKLTDNLLSLNSEAFQITQKIFETMNEEVEREGSEFVLIILPSPNDLKLFEQDVAYKNNWEMMASAACKHVNCIDLTDALRQVPAGQLDSGYDGTHYGPRANELVARFISGHLESADVIGP